MNLRILALALLAASPLAQADSYSQCMKGAMTTASMRECSGAELKRQDDLLNKHYKVAMASLGEEQKGKLRDAQRKWVAYRDANCGMYYTMTGGTIDQLNGIGCEVDMTKQRAGELENLPKY